MPIRDDLKHHYQTAAWRAMRPKIFARAGNCCEFCRRPNATKVRCRFMTRYTLEDPKGVKLMWWLDPNTRQWFNNSGQAEKPPRQAWRKSNSVVQLGRAHLNGVAGDDREENVAALCRWCHLRHDEKQHRETRATRKDAARPLLQLMVS